MCNSGTHDQMVMSMTWKHQQEPTMTVNASDVGDKIRWEQLDGTIDLTTGEATRMSLDIGPC